MACTTFIIRWKLILVLQLNYQMHRIILETIVYFFGLVTEWEMCNFRAYENFRTLATRGNRRKIKILMFNQNEGSKISLPIRRNSQSGSCNAFPRIPYAQVATTSVVNRAHSSFASNSAVVSPSKENTNETVKVTNY